MASQSSLTRPVEDRSLLGIGLVLIAVALFSCLDTTAKFLVVNGLSPLQVAFIRYLVTFIAITAAFVPRHGRAILATNNLKLEIVRGICLLSVTVLNFVALIFLPLTVTAAIAFTMPLIVTALSVPLLGEKVGWRRWAAICIGFAGALVIIRPGGEAFHPAALLAVLNAFVFAIYNILNRKLAGVDSVPTQQFYVALVAVVCLAPASIPQWVWPANGFGWMLLLAVGFFGTVGHFLITTAHRFAPASILAPFFYPQIVFMSILSWVVFEQGADLFTAIGALIVVGSGLYVWLRERRSTPEMARTPPTS